jgi:ribosomal protein S12 methylthiotransferase
MPVGQQNPVHSWLQLLKWPGSPLSAKINVMRTQERPSGQPDKIRCCIAVYGCAKNQVDAEEMASRLTAAGYELTGDAGEADVVIVHTCGFIEDAKKESIEGIFQAVEAVKDRPDAIDVRDAEGVSNAGDVSTAGTMRETSVPVIVTGCLSQRYPDEILKEIPEIAGVAGTAAPRDIVEIVGEVLGRDRAGRVRRVGTPGRGAPGSEGESIRFDTHLKRPWAYLRVAEGCRHHCTYCAIPSIRGGLTSRPEDEIIAEARHLSSLGIVELNLIAQDLSDYGYDREGKRRLASLVRRLSGVPGVRWIRLLYVRPDGVDDELAESMALPNVAPYIDLPVEHGSPRILRLMGRPGTEQILRAVERLRKRVPDLYLRTTVITGFPGETEQDVLATADLLCEIGAHRVGVFPFSREEGTAAYNLPGVVPGHVARDRAEYLRRLGLSLSAESAAAMMGKEIGVLLERPSLRPGYWIGRGPHQAPEVDGVTYVKITGQGSEGRPADASLSSPASGAHLTSDTAHAGDRFIRACVTSPGILTLFAHETLV